MKIEHIDEEKLRKMIIEVIGKHLDISKYDIFFFGSRVEGTSDERSDIDVGIEGDKPVPADAMQNILEDMEELPILYRIDVVDWKKFPDTSKKSTKKEYIHRRKK